MSASGLWTVVGGADRGGIIVRAERGLDSSVAGQRLATGAKVKGLECFEGRMRYELLEGQGPSEGWVTVSLKDKDLLVRVQEVTGEKEADSEDSTSDGDSQNAPYVTSGDSDRESPKAMILNLAYAEANMSNMRVKIDFTSFKWATSTWQNGLSSDKISKDEKANLTNTMVSAESLRSYASCWSSSPRQIILQTCPPVQEALRLYNAKFGESRDGSRQSYNRKDRHGRQVFVRLR
ncbi:unnamed protein product [Symbiodinium sp. CCMP2592]|nr:unnamed protein product [Symbiodinium sp. CCMP2592]